jgi:hypothetical protein
MHLWANVVVTVDYDYRSAHTSMMMRGKWIFIDTAAAVHY